MAKIIYWYPDNRKFKLIPRYVQRFKELGLDNIPNKIGEYDNGDVVFIESIEAMRKEIPNVLRDELKKYVNHQSLQTHFIQVYNSFEPFAIQFWMKMLEANPQLLEKAELERMYNAIVYTYSFEEFLYECKKLSITLSDEMQNMFKALVSRREVVQDLRARRDESHDNYLKFCENVGMRTFSHIPPNDGFKIVEYDETKYRAEITIQTNYFGANYETLELIPI